MLTYAENVVFKYKTKCFGFSLVSNLILPVKSFAYPVAPQLSCFDFITQYHFFFYS